MAEAVISSLLDVLVGELIPALKEEVGLIRGVDEELDNLKRMLSMIHSLLADAEERQIKERAIKIWLAELKNVAYDADDVLDEFAYDSLRRKLMEADEKIIIKKVCNSFLSCCLLSPIRFQRNVAHKIKEINKRVDKISRDGDRFRLKKGDEEIRQILDREQQQPSSSLLPKNSQSQFFGRDNDKKQIMDLLVSDEQFSGGEKDVSVISIIGMGGLGKTTLAQHVYNNENVQKHFQVKAWVCVSEDFDISRLTREIIDSATGGNCSPSNFDSMQLKLKEILSEKRFLIVLDDVWNKNKSDWDKLRPPFSFGAKGSKIIATTRDEDVSTTMDTDHPCHLKFLSNDDCLSLFLRHAFVGGNCNDANPELMEIGKELVEKRCQGLPLAAKALGGLLSSKRDVEFWKSILNSQVWSSMEDESEVMKALRVSYHHLPPHIKQCFAFCSIFPKDHVFEKDTLVKFWMAQGFIKLKQGIILSTLEEIGSEYFDFLLSRSFFQVEEREYFFWKEERYYYKMHDCIHDLAMFVSYDECFRFEHGKPTFSLEKGHRHSSFIIDSETKVEDFHHIYKCEGLRTFFLPLDWGDLFDVNQILGDLTLKLRGLRLLVLQRPGITKLPGSISNLKHLRCLDLSRTNIVQLPESVSSLYHLKTLNLEYCYELRQLPKETRKLVNLRHLNLNFCLKLESMPPEMGRLTCLQMLPRFVVSRERGCGIGELKGLTALKGAISIIKLENVSNAKEAEEANLKDKPKIEELRLTWDMNPQQDQASLKESEKILEALQPHTNIKTLSIAAYEGKNYPSWMQNTMLPNLECFKMGNCTNSNSFPPLGQLRMLKLLSFYNILGVKCIGREFYGDGQVKGFPSLKELSIINIPNLEEWCEPEEGEFPSLEILYIRDCPKLRKMPNNFSTLKRLTLIGHQSACLPKYPSLDELRLVNCNENLLRWVPHLTSLSRLTISSFEELKSLPMGLRSLTSLKDLTIDNCPQLLSLPEEGLPTSLQNLYIYGCPKLTERCRKGDGEDWAKISHISKIEIDGKIFS